VDWLLSMMSYDDRWVARRKVYRDVLDGKLAGKFDSHHVKYTHRLLSRLLEAPENFMQEAEF